MSEFFGDNSDDDYDNIQNNMDIDIINNDDYINVWNNSLENVETYQFYDNNLDDLNKLNNSLNNENNRSLLKYCTNNLLGKLDLLQDIILENLALSNNMRINFYNSILNILNNNKKFHNIKSVLINHSSSNDEVINKLIIYTLLLSKRPDLKYLFNSFSGLRSKVIKLQDIER